MVAHLNNRCGACTLCCRLTSVPELDKPVYVWCKFCQIGEGCGIYETRPPSCQRFECYWYQHGELSQALRPDKCKIVFEKLPKSDTYLALQDPGRPDAWRSPAARGLIADLVKAGNAVVVGSGFGRNKHVLLPVGRTERDVLADLGTAAKDLQLANGK